jgi:hypothetical protein
MDSSGIRRPMLPEVQSKSNDLGVSLHLFKLVYPTIQYSMTLDVQITRRA